MNLAPIGRLNGRLLEMVKHVIFLPMKTATAQEAKDRWAEVLRWVAAGEEVQITEHDKIVAKVVPAATTPVAQPDFLSRAKAIWGEHPAGQPLSEMVEQGRGGEA